jgi:hypothetical protein
MRTGGRKGCWPHLPTPRGRPTLSPITSSALMPSVTASSDSSSSWSSSGSFVLRLLVEVVQDGLHRGRGPLVHHHHWARFPTPQDAAISEGVAQQDPVAGLPLGYGILDLVVTGGEGGDVLRLDQPAFRAVLGPHSKDAAGRPVGQISPAVGAAFDHGRTERSEAAECHRVVLDFERPFGTGARR